MAGGRAGPAPKNLRMSLDTVDRRIVRELTANARLANNALAERVGVAPSTCLARVRALCDGGVIRGFYADVDPVAVGCPIQAMIAVRLQPTARSHLTGFGQRMAQLPAVLDVFFMAGAEDFLIHVAVAGTNELRDFVVKHLSSDRAVAHTETNLIFQHARGANFQ